MGFPKRSRIFSGNISEQGTLQKMIKTLHSDSPIPEGHERKNITVVLDAGMASEENLALLKALGYDYMVRARNQPVAFSEIEPDHFLTIKRDKTNKVEVQLIQQDGEHILYCKRFLKTGKE